ncbi:MAG: hypothetical protein HUJ26_18880 [Planctomycetaceae bacterium]|nr:hypothetical protein [Planctomycetaceae bacterium]
MTDSTKAAVLGGPLDGKEFTISDLDTALSEFYYWQTVSRGKVRRGKYILVIKEVDGEMTFRYQFEASEDFDNSQARGPSVAKQFKNRKRST